MTTTFYATERGEVVPARAYRYISRNAEYVEEIKRTGVIPANPDPRGTYFAFEDYSKPNPGKLQVPHDGAIKVCFDTLSLLDDIRTPRGKWGQANYLEPITADFPEFGSGGAHQAVTNKQIRISDFEFLN